MAEQSRILDSFFKHVQTCLVILDRHFNFIRVNDAYAKAYGRDVSAFAGRNHFELYPSDELKAAFERAVQTKEPFQAFATPFTFPDHPGWGVTHWDLRLVPILDDRGEVEFLVFSLNDVTDRVQAQEAVRQSEERYREMIMSNFTGAYVSTPAGALLACNPAFASMLGFASVEEALGTDLASPYKDPEDRREFLDALRAERRLDNRETEYRRSDGKPLHAIENAVGVFDEGGDLIEIRGYLIDTTQRKHLEDQLRQAQKMEAVGQLAGGIAHDFNNILTAILGFSELLLASFEPGDPRCADVEEVLKAGEHGASLTRQLLAFSRRQVVQPVILDVNVVVTGIESLIRRLIGENIDFRTILRASQARVKMDKGQLEQVLANLVVNARDAMPDVGKLTVETSAGQLDELGRGRFKFRPGRYVLISVSDTGTGMDAETQSRIFEPFFTTKEIGRGTGLGLSTVYGIVKQASGFIDVQSEPGSTTFKIYLPLTDEPLTPAEGAPCTIRPDLRDTTILVVEDDPAVRELIRKTLAAEGYRILEAENGLVALGLLEQREKPVDLVLTDVVMPGMSGRSLADRVGQLYPELKILFMSGYSSIADKEVLDFGVYFLEKPFSPEVLKAEVLKMLR
ncbi:MAG: PAS domain-containing protein [Gemmatimonadaceae bacterium]|nr:PAS domain-containing protein [Gemmatimonadaceae bacterium]